MLPMDTKLVTCGNDVVLMSKLCHQTSPVPYSTENLSKPGNKDNSVHMFNSSPSIQDSMHNKIGLRDPITSLFSEICLMLHHRLSFSWVVRLSFS